MDNSYIVKKSDEAHNSKNTFPTVHYGGSNTMLWVYFSATGPGSPV